MTQEFGHDADAVLSGSVDVNTLVRRSSLNPPT